AALAAPPTPIAPSATRDSAYPGSGPGPESGPLTDWMSPDELEAALAFGKTTAKVPTAVAPRNAHATAPPAIPKWVVPLVAVSALAILLGSVAVVLLFAG